MEARLFSTNSSNAMNAKRKISDKNTSKRKQSRYKVRAWWQSRKMTMIVTTIPRVTPTTRTIT